MTTPLSSPATTALGTTALATAAPTTPAAAAKKAGDSAMGPDAFMKLLVAQLKYQNPMAPADGQSYMTQMATFTQVEKLDQLVKAQADAAQWQQRVSAEGMVGRSVTGTTDGVASSGTVVGVRYQGGAALLELSDGTTLAPSAVEHVRTLATPATATAAAPTATTSAPTTTAAAPAPATAGTSSTTAPAAGTPSP